ncbi:MAG: penicillin-binding protein 1C [Deltaproteobacteria bacterium]|nr:MAG: penicillin-binding protein 1C [Deltaproteobacteria bacterium]
MPHLLTKLPRPARRLGLVLCGLLLVTGLSWGALELSFTWVPLPDRLSATASPVVRWRDGTTAHLFLAPDDRARVAVRLDQVDPSYVEALIRLEDKRFEQHPGVDPLALGRALLKNLTAGRVRTGASTLTMQVVRVVEPRPRTLRSKAVEAWRALQLERCLSKREILEAYLTFTPYGRNIEGVEAASWAYFGHGAEKLAPHEIATLLAVPQAPTSRHPSPSNQPRLQRARDQIAGWLLTEGALAQGQDRDDPQALLQEIVDRPAPDRLRSFPRAVPEVARWLRARHPEELDQISTLDGGTQAVIERIVRRDQRAREHRGIRHVSVVVAHTETGEVTALIGSPYAYGAGPGDQVAMFDVPRSPGSALKPFLYAQGIDQGLVLPEQLVRDIPAAYRGYAPRNYEEGYDGLVRLESALSRSLNLPFVFLLEELGVDAFIDLLGRSGARSLSQERGYYGLSSAVGGIELTPLEVTALYVALASDGRATPLSLTEPGLRPPPSAQLFAPGAAWLTRRALKLRDRPDFPSRRDLTAIPRHIHWKTGTSFGHRDAWACGSGPTHTACVWLGNADMTPSRHLVGAEAAGDLLFDILEAVGPSTPWVDPPTPDLTRIEVDAWSGYLPTAASPSRRDVWALRHAVPTTPDPFHRLIEVDLDTGEAVTPLCRAGRRTELRTVIVFPSAVRRWLTDQHRRLPQLPVYAEGCQLGGRADPPKILSPPHGETRVLIEGMEPSAQTIPLEADSAMSGKLAWFVDGRFLGEAAADERLWWTPTPGEHTFMVRDEAGRAGKAVLTVRMASELTLRQR